MISKVEEFISEITDKAYQMVPDTQPWPHQFRLRNQEWKILLSLYEMPRADKVLEIGCGNGFNSALLSYFAKKVIATDLSNYDIKTHSIGMEKAKKLLDALEINNCELISCSGEYLPFENETFDLIFSQYVLEHIPDKEKAVGEMKRVLKKGGILICLVPNFIERVLYPPVFYQYLLKRVLFYLVQKIKKYKIGIDVSSPKSSFHKEEDRDGEKFSGRSKTFINFRDNYPNFPFPEPHGAYRNSFEEMMGHLPRSWVGLFEKSGFRKIKILSTMIIPWSLIGLFHSNLPLWIYERFSGINSIFGNKKIFTYLGYNLCLICEK